MVSVEGGGIGEESKNGVDLAQYAEIAARLRRFSRELGSAWILAGFGFSEEAWAQIDTEWSRAIDEDFDAGRNVLVLAFAEVFLATRETLKVPALAAEPPEPTAAPQAPFKTEVPSYLQTFGAAIAGPSGSAGFAESGGRGSARSLKTEVFQSFATKPALPFEATRATSVIPSIPELSVERYASLRVELALKPGERAEILRRYRLSEEQTSALDATWTYRMAREPGLMDAWELAGAQYRAWLTQR